MKGLIESLIVGALSLLIANYKGKFHEILASIGDKLNDKIEATGTQIDDIAKVELVAAIKEAFLPQLEIDGVDGAPGAQA